MQVDLPQPVDHLIREPTDPTGLVGGRPSSGNRHREIL